MSLTKFEKELKAVIALIPYAEYQPTGIRGFFIIIQNYRIWVIEDDGYMRAKPFDSVKQWEHVWPIPSLAIDRILKFQKVCERYQSYLSIVKSN